MDERNILQIIRQCVICYNTRYRYDYEERNTQKQKICHICLCYTKDCYIFTIISLLEKSPDRVNHLLCLKRGRFKYGEKAQNLLGQIQMNLRYI